MNIHHRFGQIAIEFLLLIGVGLFILLIALITITHVSKDKIDEKTYYELDDFGLAIRQELVLASEMEDGYTRKINIPVTVNGRAFTITSIPVTNETSMLVIMFNELNLTYVIPPIQGAFLKGKIVFII